MSDAQGFLVVDRSPEYIRRSPNCRYRGIYRTPTWSPNDYARGWDDPYVFGHYTDEVGLIRDRTLAQEVLERFAEVQPRDSLEILYVRAVKEPSASLSASSLGTFLGYDVGTYNTFWSILADLPSLPHDDARLADVMQRLNENGLFDSYEDAASYLDLYRTTWLEDRDVPLSVWEVYAVTV
jgi:hypothetical protein